MSRNLKGTLNNMAESMRNLANRLDDEGRELSNAEKELIRIATLPMVTETTSIIKGAYLSGNADWLHDAIGDLKNITDDFI